MILSIYFYLGFYLNPVYAQEDQNHSPIPRLLEDAHLEFPILIGTEMGKAQFVQSIHRHLLDRLYEFFEAELSKYQSTMVEFRREFALEGSVEALEHLVQVDTELGQKIVQLRHQIQDLKDEVGKPAKAVDIKIRNQQLRQNSQKVVETISRLRLTAKKIQEEKQKEKVNHLIEYATLRLDLIGFVYSSAFLSYRLENSGENKFDPEPLVQPQTREDKKVQRKLQRKLLGKVLLSVPMLFGVLALNPVDGILVPSGATIIGYFIWTARQALVRLDKDIKGRWELAAESIAQELEMRAGKIFNHYFVQDLERLSLFLGDGFGEMPLFAELRKIETDLLPSTCVDVFLGKVEKLTQTLLKNPVKD